ncbi:MAG: RNA methyltransferase [Anaerolineales bacterium]|nr:RNA methyltransferase [Anaerolineales bacterium]
MVQCYAQTMPGIEKITWLEIRDRLPGASFSQYLFAKEQNGMVIFDYDGPLDAVQQLRTAEDTFLLALYNHKVSRTRRDLTLIQESVHKSEAFGQAGNALMRWRKFSQPPTYRVISRKYGKHDYRRIDFEKAVSEGLKKRYPRWTPVADGGDVEVWANLLGSQLLIGFRLSGREMRHRYQKRVELPASLRPSVAAAMVYLTEPAPDDVFLDPMCGSGTILLERRSAGAYGALLGGDVVPKRVDASYQNLLGRKKMKRHGRFAYPALSEWNAKALPFATNSIDKIVTNLPFGQQIAADLQQLYPAFFAEVARVLRVNGRAVILSSEYDLVKESVRQQPALHILTGYSMAILGRWGRIYLLEKR